MRYELAIVDTFDRESLTYEIWDEGELVAEVYKDNNNDIILTCFQQKGKKLFFKEFFNILNKIEKEVYLS